MTALESELLEALKQLQDAFLGTSIEHQGDSMRKARAAIKRAESSVSEPDMDIDLAKMVVRSAGYSLVSQRFIVNFAEFIQDWRKGDFDLSPLAARDVEACFEAWQEDINQKEVTTPPAAAVSEPVACKNCHGDGIDGEDSDGINSAVTWACTHCNGTGIGGKK